MMFVRKVPVQFRAHLIQSKVAKHSQQSQTFHLSKQMEKKTNTEENLC